MIRAIRNYNNKIIKIKIWFLKLIKKQKARLVLFWPAADGRTKKGWPSVDRNFWSAVNFLGRLAVKKKLAGRPNGQTTKTFYYFNQYFYKIIKKYYLYVILLKIHLFKNKE